MRLIATLSVVFCLALLLVNCSPSLPVTSAVKLDCTLLTPPQQQALDQVRLLC